MSETNVRSVPGDLIYTFKDGDRVVNTLDPNKLEEIEYVSAQHGGLAKIEYHALDGNIINVGETVKAHPEVLE